MESVFELKPFLDDYGKLMQYPAKRRKQFKALEYLASKFEHQRRYAEREVTDILNTWHTFGDPCMLRRDLCDARFLNREPDGSAYWLEPVLPQWAD